MYKYTLEQWLLFFFIYCFLGWVWESIYVSAKTKKLINRGFMHGPLLPIYGFGAISVLILALPVRDNYLLVFVFGMLGATIIEYFTGMIMERLFHMRYWDYSEKFCNLKGHICLGSSVAWGIFSVALVEVAHSKIENIVFKIPDNVAEISAFVFSICAAVDFTQSFNEALDLREMLEKVTENNQKLRILEKRVDVLAAVVDDDIKALKEKSARKFHEIEEYIRNPKLYKNKRKNIRLGRSIKILTRNPNAISKDFTEALNDFKEIIKKHKK